MPWCEDCARYFAPSAMTPEGECPECGADLDGPEAPGEEEASAPWHFKLLVAMVVVYLVYRGYEMFFA